MTFVLELVVFLFSVIIHEVSHGVVAERLGDSTARDAGRITLNPLVHLDPFGSVILPILLALPALVGAPVFIFGWAKPVPYNPANLPNPRTGAVKIALAGPLTNLLMAVLFGIALRMVVAGGFDQFVLPLAVIVYINLLLGVFNLFPIPPLDGSKLLFLILPEDERGFRIMMMLEQFGFILLLAVIFWLPGIIGTVVGTLFRLITGYSFF